MSTFVSRFPTNKLMRNAGILFLFIMTGLLIGKLSLQPSNIRLLLTLALLIIFMAIQVKSRQIALLILLIYLPFLGMIRRVLIPIAGWNSMDTLVILGSAFVIFLSLNWLTRTYIVREPIKDDTLLFKLIRCMLLVDFLQVFNPLQGSLLVGFAGIIYYIVPVLFMILGREYIDELWIKKIFLTVYIIGIIAAFYGFKQFWFGMYPFEQAWVDISGYTALQVYSLIRPIAIFTSSAEYAYFLVIGIMVGWGYFIRGSSRLKLISLIGVLIMFAALFIVSARGPIVFGLGGLFFMTIMSVKKTSAKILLSVVALLVLMGLFFGMSKMNTSNDLIYHTVSGLTDPLGEESTTMGHANYMIRGFIEGIKNPIGYGLGSTTIAASKFGGNLVSSEVDMSNKFLATGIIGGFLYLVIVIKAIWLSFKKANNGSVYYLIILGMLLSNIFQWLTGGHYSVVAVLWIAIGYLDRNDIPINSKLTNKADF